MPCPTCTATMQSLGKVEAGFKYYYCPRCGTLKMDDNDYEQSEIPMLVKRTRKIVEMLADPGQLVAHEELRLAGILECVYRPEERVAT